MKKMLFACLLFCTPAFSQETDNTIIEILKTDDDTNFKYALIGILNNTIKENASNEKLVKDIKKIIDVLKLPSTKLSNHEISNELKNVINFVSVISITNPKIFIDFVIIGKTLTK